MTQNQIVAALGVVLSFVFEFIPGVREWFDGLETKAKVALLSGLTLAIAVGALALACAGVQTGSGAVCPDLSQPQTYWDLVVAWLTAAGAAQTAYTGVKLIKSSAG